MLEERLRIWLLALAIVPQLAGLVSAQTLIDPNLEVELVASGLNLPTSLAFVGDGDILVLQKNDGQVRRILNGVLLAEPVLDVAVHSQSERGLLGIATHPEFLNNRAVYLYYTESSTGDDTSDGGSEPLGNRVVRYRWDGSRLVEPVMVLDLPATPGPNHDGGIITFGPDDALYVVIGDLNRNGQLQNFPTGDPPDDTGVVLRVSDLGAALPDNPFYDPRQPKEALNRVYAYGVRNSFGLAFDPLSGDLWDTENGPSAFDEVNRILPGFNSGWEPIMGPVERSSQSVADLWMIPGAVYRDPEFSWAVPVAPTAMAFAHSPILGCDLQNDLLVGDNNCGTLYRFRPTQMRDGLQFSSQDLSDKVADNSFGRRCLTEMDEIIFGDDWGAVTDLENGPDGRLYGVSLDLGAVLRISPNLPPSQDADADGVDDTCDCDATDGMAFGVPTEVPRIRVSGADAHPDPLASSVVWDPQAATAGTGTRYTLVSGDAAALSTDEGFASACTLSSGLDRPLFTDARRPQPGAAFYYVTRAGNTCDNGTYGDAGALPDARDALDVALLPTCLCGERSAGALVTFSVAEEVLSVWITNANFIDRALELLATGETQVPVFDTLVDGRDCDAQWSWHPDPQDVSFADATIELCDGLPSHIEANKEEWFQTVGTYCPWGAIVTGVDDRR